MQRAWTQRIGQYALGTAFLAGMAGAAAAAGDDNQNPSLLGRLFRMGGSSSGSGSGSGSGSNNGHGSGSGSASSRLPYGGSSYNSPPSSGFSSHSSFGNSLPAGGSSSGSYSSPLPHAGSSGAPLPTFGGGPETPMTSVANGPTERLTPRSRVSTAVTGADPVLTRFALGKSNDGSSFGMFLQVFADGTVVDSEGVHHVRAADLKPILEAVQSGEMYRLRGHCGAPSTDFIEYVHIVAYERRLGRLQAHSFSYSGNPQGCDHVVRHLHNAIEGLQAKITRQPTQGNMAAAPMGPAGVGMTGATAAPIGSVPAPPLTPAPSLPATSSRTPALPSTSTGTGGAVIPLSPPDPGR